jgi:outer membrane protein assembly factor BamB
MIARTAAVVLVSGLALVVGVGSTSVGNAVSADTPLPTTISGRYSVSGSVNTTARIGNTVYVGGEFSHIAPRTGSAVVVPVRGGRIEPVRAEVAGGPVNAVVADGSGGWYVAGSFTTVGDERRDGLAHLQADGSLDRAFAPPALGELDALALAGDILVVAAGPPDGVALTHALSPTSGAELPIEYERPSGAGAARVLVASGGRLYVGFGNRRLAAYGVATGARFWSRKFCESCSQNSGGVLTLALDGDRLVVGGGFIQGRSRNLTVLDAGNGAPKGHSLRFLKIVESVVVARGHVYVAHGRQRPSRSGVAVVDLASGRIRDWGAIRSSHLATDGTTVFMDGSSAKDERTNSSYVGIYAARAGTQHAVLRRVTQSLSGYPNAFAPQGRRLLVGGSLGGVGGPVRHNLAAFDGRTGRLLPWHPSAADSGCCGVTALAARRHTIYVGGPFKRLSGVARAGLGAVSADGAGRVLPWHPRLAPSSEIDALAAGAGRVFVGGSLDFHSGPGQDNHVAAFSAKGAGAHLRFSPKLSFEFLLSAMTVWKHTLIVGGSSIIAYSADGNGRHELWRHSAENVMSFARRGSTLYAGGNFERIDNTSRLRLAAFALDRRGALLPFKAAVPFGVEALAWHGSDLVFGGGDGYQKPHQVLGAVTEDGTVEPWHVDVPPSGLLVAGIEPVSGGLFVAGLFDWIGEPGNQAPGHIAWLR